MNYLDRIKRTFEFALMCAQRKIRIGNRAYYISGYFKNKFAVAARDADLYESWAENVFRIIFKLRVGAFIDVGANVGQTMIRVLSIDEKRQYIGFEPQAAGCYFIQDFIVTNNLEKHAIIQAGLSDKQGIIKLGLRHQCDQAASTIEEYRPDNFYSFFQYIPVLEGDEVIKSFNPDHISLLKIDVEGGELEVLYGLKKSIEKYSPYIIFEVLPDYLISTGEKLDEQIIENRNKRNSKIEKFLRDHAYNIYQLPENGEPLLAESIKTSKEKNEKLISNYVAVPVSESNQFETAFIEYLRVKK